MVVYCFFNHAYFMVSTPIKKAKISKKYANGQTELDDRLFFLWFFGAILALKSFNIQSYLVWLIFA